MYQVQVTEFGFRFTFEDFIKQEEMQAFYDESLKALKDSGRTAYGVLVDMRNLKPLPPESKAIVEKCQRAFKEGGLVRSALLLSNPITTMQFKRIAKESGVYKWERFVDGSENENPEKIALDWIVNQIDPDK